MKSTAHNVKQYLSEVPIERQEALKKLRALCLAELSGYEESMVYNMPSYIKDDQVEVAFASQKQHICIYILKHDVMRSHEALLKGINHGKGCIRYASPHKIDFQLIEKLLKATVMSDNKIC